MSVDTAVIAALAGDAGVSALAAGGVFVRGGRQGAAYPYVTVQRISTAGASHLSGANTLEWPRFQIDSWSADGALEALTLAAAVRLAIDNVTIIGSPTFTATFQDQSGPAPDEETRNFRVSQDYFIFHER